MILKLAKLITNELEKKNIINNDISIYIYGYAMIISYALSSAFIILISIMSNNFLQGVFYLLYFSFLRDYFGGYHANSYFQCILYFIICFIFHSFVLIKINFITLFSISIFLLSIVYSYIPIEHPNKPLSASEKTTFKKKAKFRLILSMFLALCIKDYNSLGNSICSLIIIVCLLGFIQILINKKRKDDLYVK